MGEHTTACVFRAFLLSSFRDCPISLFNRPQVWWAQGDRGTTASPGGWIRVFGRNLGMKTPGKAVVRFR